MTRGFARSAAARLGLAGAALLIAIAGCTVASPGQTPAVPAWDGMPRTLSPAEASMAQAVWSARNADLETVLHQEAADDLARWDAAAASAGLGSFVPVGELTGQIGDWELSVGDNDKPALMAGLIVAASALPIATPPDGQVTWTDGTTQSVPLISAEQAFEAIKTDAAATGGQCPECTPLQITGAELTTIDFMTSRGSARTPAWAFMVAGTAVRVTRIAVATKISVSPVYDPNRPHEGLTIDWASGNPESTELTVGFVGAEGPATEPCGEDYTTEAVEDQYAIVVIVIRHPNTTWQVACDAVGHPRTATVTLAAPLGSRAVLEVVDGQPVTIQPGP